MAEPATVQWFRFQPFMGRGAEMPLLYGLRFSRYSPSLNAFMKAFNKSHKYEGLPLAAPAGWMAKSKCWWLESVGWEDFCLALQQKGNPLVEIDRPSDVEHFGEGGIQFVGISIDEETDRLQKKLLDQIKLYEEKHAELDSLLKLTRRIDDAYVSVDPSGIRMIDLQQVFTFRIGDFIRVRFEDGGLQVARIDRW